MLLVLEILCRFKKWIQLGRRLGVDYSTMKYIDQTSHGEAKVVKCMMRMLVAWLKKSDNVSSCHGPSWKQLIESLRAIEENSLADDMERRLLNKRSCDQSSTISSTRRPDDESSGIGSSINTEIEREEIRQHNRQRKQKVFPDLFHSIVFIFTRY